MLGPSSIGELTMPISGHGWELLIQRRAVQQGATRARTVGTYQVFHDGIAVAGLAGTTAESEGPSSNTRKGVRIRPGSYPLGTQIGEHYRTNGYDPSDSVNVNPKPGLELWGTGDRSEILIHPGKNAFLSSIGCINLCTRLPDAKEVVDYVGSRRRVIALIDDLKTYLGARFPSVGEKLIPDSEVVIEEGPSVATVIASSFADPADVAAYRAAISAGRSEQEALRVGDNAVGCWGDDTSSDNQPICALPPEDWKSKWGPGHEARGKKVAVTYQGKTVVGELRDTMPSRAKITNGAGIDLNPGFAKAFGIRPPFLVRGVSWEWAE
jgi:hypothetical protein